MTRRPRILVTHEHAAIAESLAAALAGDGRLEVVGHVHDGPELELSVLRKRPDVLLLRPVLARGDGLALCRSVKAQLPGVRVVLAVEATDDAELLAAIEAGVDGYTTFGDDLHHLIDVLCRVDAGETVVPPLLLGDLVKRLIVRHRERAEDLDRFGRLSSREQEVLAELVDGHDQDAIAARLFISTNTVRTHIQNVLNKLEVHSRLEAVSLAVHAGWGISNRVEVGP